MGKINFSINDINSYIDILTNQSFSILPLYEENGINKVLIQKINSLNYKLNAFFKANRFDPNITIEILSFANELSNIDNHDEMRYFVLRICSLLSRLKVVEE